MIITSLSLFFFTNIVIFPGETKPGHPVTRTGSDRRPDALREEPSKAQESQNHSQDTEDDAPTTER